MKIRVRDHVRLQPERLAKVTLAATPRALLDLYCVAPGQAQAPHTHANQDKIYYVLEGRGRFTCGDRAEVLEAGEALVAAAGQPHGLINEGPDRLLVLVLVAPPPPHA